MLMKDVTRIIQAETDNEALEKGKVIKIWDGERWFAGILYQRKELYGTDKFNVVEVC